MTIVTDAITSKVEQTLTGALPGRTPDHQHLLADAMIRGGRIVKRNGFAASYSPELGVSVADGPSEAGARDTVISKVLHSLRWSSAPMAILASGIAITSPAAAQDACVTTGPDQVTCEDNGANATTPQTASGGDLVVTLEDGFGVTTSGGAALEVTSTDSVSVTGAGGTNSLIGTNGLVVVNSGAGALQILSSGPITGTNGTGVYAYNAGTDLTVDTRAGTVTGSRGGIDTYNYGYGALTITTANVSGATGVGIAAANYGTNLTINSSAGSVSGTTGVFASNYGTGALSITTANVTGTAADGINAANSFVGTSLTIDTSAGSVTGATTGISAINYGSGALQITTAGVTGTNGDGIYAYTAGTDLTIDTRAGTVTGSRAGIDAYNYGYGALSITTANVTGTASVGIGASSYGTDLTINSAAGSVSGTGGVFAANYGTGALAITTANVTGTTSDGINANNAFVGTSLTIDSSAGRVTGATNGITASNYGAGALQITTDDVAGANGDGVYAYNAGTDLTIDTRAGTVTGSRAGIDAYNYGYGALSITTANVTGTTSVGIAAASYGTNLTINSAAGSVSGTGGVFAANYGTGALSITTANVTGTAADGINAANSFVGTSLTIDTSAGSVTGATTGISAINYGSGALQITTAGVTGTNGDGIYAYTAGTDLTIDTRAGTVTGSRAGIDAYNYGYGALSITTANVTGTASVGIGASSYGTDLTINSAAGSVSGTGGVFAANYGTGALAITTANVTGTTSDGINANNAFVGTSLTIDSSAGRVTGATNGITASNYGAGALQITTDDVAGANGDGVYAYNAGTDLTIDTRAGTVTGSRAGIDTYNSGSGALSITTANVSGTASVGIGAANYGSNLTINTAAGSVSGTGGVFAANYGTGALSITTANVTGTASDGINAINSANGTNLAINTSAGTVTGQTNGISAANTGTGSLAITAAGVTGRDGIGISASVGANSTGLTITTSGTVSGALIGIDARNSSASATTIVNNGTLTAGSREAIRAASSANALITNNGRIEGFVTLGAGNDSLTNTGTFAAIGDSNFGAGTDLLTNSGTFLVQGPGAVSLTGLESFANSGRIELANGVIGNNLTLSGNFTGSGNSALIMDVDYAAGTADRFTVAGAATGSTNLTLNVIGGQQTGLISNLVIVDAGAGTAANAFTLVGGRQVNGLIEFGVNFNAGTNDFVLSSAPSIAAYETSNFGDIARNAWAQSANAFSDHMTMTRDTGTADGVRLWITGYGNNLDRERTTSTTFNGLASTYNLGYSQDAYGFLAGVDFGSETVRFGVTGGYQNNQADFDGSAGGVDLDVLSIGGYVAADLGSFWANALVKYDTINGTLDNAAAGLAADLDGSVFGGQIEAGLLLGDRDSLFLEPRVSLAYSGTDLDDIATPQGSLEFDAGESLRGKAGARVGTGFGSKGVVYIGGNYVHEFEGDDTVLFTTGQSQALIGNLPVDDYAEVTAGVAFGNADDAFGASLQGTYATGSDIEGYGATLNLRYQFGGRSAPAPAVAPPAPAPVMAPPPPPRPAPPPPPKPACSTGPHIVFFDFDKSDITAEAATILNNAITAYANCGSARVMLAGHTDTSGRASYNVGLAERRNASVRSYMAGRGVPDGQITGEAFGETQPRVPTADGVREAQNRRVEVTYGPGSGM
jgi:outer membrane protein OmpA-like peptidoglycan-associated protein